MMTSNDIVIVRQIAAWLEEIVYIKRVPSNSPRHDKADTQKAFREAYLLAGRIHCPKVGFRTTQLIQAVRTVCFT